MAHVAHEPFVLASGTRIPRCIYGTAEKEDASLVFDAIKAGFRGLDSAAQPQSYDEEVVGEAIRRALDPPELGGLGLRREDLYVQTKFTTPRGQDFSSGNAPYDPEDPIPIKVSKSIESSLRKLGVTWIDTLLLHGPMPMIAETLEVWKAFESLVPHRTRNLGLSNVSLQEIESVCAEATIVPAVVQNRFLPRTRYNTDVRTFCVFRNINYQAFSIMRSNHHLLADNIVGWLAERTGSTRQEALFALVLSLGSNHSVLIGTKDATKATSDLMAISRLGKVPGFVQQGFLEILDQATARYAAIHAKHSILA